ncbi:MAG: hypothetical protein ACRDH8_08595 [Actinomycetota bacterium]
MPLWLFAFGAATAVIVSFVALGALWRRPRMEEPRDGRPLPGWAQAVLTSPVVEWIVRLISLGLFLLVFVAAADGRSATGANLAPVFVYVWFWVGLAFVHAFLGNWWATLSPWDTIARLLGIGEHPRRPYPPSWGAWPAGILALGFLWMELVYPAGAEPRSLAVAIAVYTVITLAGMLVFGRDAWNRKGEAFAVYFGLLSLMAPVARAADGRVVLRAPLSGLPQLRPRPGLVAFVLILIGSTSFDGFTGTALWDSWTANLTPTARALAGTTGLLAVIMLVAGAFALSMLAASAVARIPWHPLAVRFVHTLVPIAFAYAVAHYFSFLLLEGQGGIALLSDPLGDGWNLFGTAAYTINFALLSAAAIWYVQVAAIVVGHISGVMLAHDRAIAAFHGGQALRTQYALLAIMVVFTVGGLVILSGG